MTYAVIAETVYETETAEQIAAAAEALREAGLTQTPIYAGDVEAAREGNDPDQVRTSQILFA